MCTALVKEVVSYYNRRNRNVYYACLLDATKALDCVRYDKLFELLLKKDIPGTVIRLLQLYLIRIRDSMLICDGTIVCLPSQKWKMWLSREALYRRHYFVYTLMNCYEDYGKLMWAVM